MSLLVFGCWREPRALLSTTGPVLAASERAGTTVERLAAFATWVDSGLAVGPLIGGVAVARFGLPMLYQALAVAIGVGYWSPPMAAA